METIYLYKRCDLGDEVIDSKHFFDILIYRDAPSRDQDRGLSYTIRVREIFTFARQFWSMGIEQWRVGV